MHNSSSIYEHSKLDIKTDPVRKTTKVNNSLNDNNLLTIRLISELFYFSESLEGALSDDMFS